MSHLDTIESEGDQRLEAISSALLAGMGPDGYRPRRMRDRYRLGNFQPCFPYVSGLSGTEVAVECLAGITNVAAFYQGAGDVRTPNGAACRFLHDGLEVYADAQMPQPLDDSARASLAGIAKDGKTLLEKLRPRYVKGEQVNLAITVVGTQLDAAHHPDSEWACSQLRFLQAAQRIVIGESDGCEPGRARRIDYRRRSERTVGRGRVHVQIDLGGRPRGLARGSHCL